MIFATDLDRTMIYSPKFLNNENKNLVTLVETLDGKDISYMSNFSLKKLEEINSILYVVPVTTRSIEQFKRINTFKYCKYAITSNGGTILQNGEILEEWEQHILKIVDKQKNKMTEIMDFLSNQMYITREPCLVDGKFIFSKTDNIEECENILEKKLDKELWNYTIQSQKVYVIPKEITKSNAIKFLKEKLGEKDVIAAGDGKMDKDMLDIANIAILPKHGELFIKHKYKKDKLIFVDDGIFSSDRIIEKVYEIYKGGNKFEKELQF